MRILSLEVRGVGLGGGVGDCVGPRQRDDQNDSCCQDRKLQVKGNQAITKAERLRKKTFGKSFSMFTGYLFVDLEYYDGRKEQIFREFQITSKTIRFGAGPHVFNPSRRVDN